MLVSITDSDAFASYITDASNTHGRADCVFVPEHIEQVQEAVRRCYTEGTEIHIAGNGTGLVGGRVPTRGAVISLERLRKHSIDIPALRGTVQSGLSMREWQQAVSDHGLLYPPDPTEWSAAMGGTFATNASGARTFRYGPTRRYVEALRVVLASGELLSLRRGDSVAQSGLLHLRTGNFGSGSVNVSTDTSGNSSVISVPVPSYSMPSTRKHAAGYYSTPSMDAVDLFIGSEGTLGVIVEADVRLVPEPENVLGMIVFFTNHDSLLDAVDVLRGDASTNSENGSRQSLSQSRLVEFFDQRALAMIRPKYPQIPERALAALWIEVEYNAKEEDQVFEEWTGFLDSATDLSSDTWFASDARRHAELRAFRHALPSAVYEKVSDSGSTKIGTDIAVPPHQFRTFFSFYQRVLNEYNVDYVLFGHIGDCHLHANIFARSPEEHARMMLIYDMCIAEGLRLGGTVSAEHGIGKLKKKYLHAMYGDTGIEAMRAVKKALDPTGIFSPGNMFDA